MRVCSNVDCPCSEVLAELPEASLRELLVAVMERGRPGLDETQVWNCLCAAKQRTLFE
jgi:hypothetical protein